MNAREMPLTGPPPAEVPLDDSPLVRVIAQVRFPLIASVERREFIAPFQEAIRKRYPVLRAEQSRGFVLSPPGGVSDARATTSWCFQEATGPWRVVLAPGFAALETTKYTSRDDFLTRLALVMQALRDHVDPQVVDRIGVRYVDRVTGANLSDLAKLVRPEVAGILGTPLCAHTKHAISESLFVLPDGAGQVLTRWGLLPAHTTVDPAAVDPIAEKSWILDVDVFQAESCVLDVDAIVDQARGFAERIYSIFRWAVTAEFLRRYGGKP